MLTPVLSSSLINHHMSSHWQGYICAHYLSTCLSLEIDFAVWPERLQSLPFIWNVRYWFTVMEKLKERNHRYGNTTSCWNLWPEFECRQMKTDSQSWTSAWAYPQWDTTSEQCTRADSFPVESPFCMHDINIRDRWCHFWYRRENMRKREMHKRLRRFSIGCTGKCRWNGLQNTPGSSNI